MKARGLRLRLRLREELRELQCFSPSNLRYTVSSARLRQEERSSTRSKFSPRY